MRIAIGSDHVGFPLKERLREALEEWGYEAQDFGCRGEEPVDYPDVAQAVARAVAAGEEERGILICSNGVGMSISANKVKGVRAALCHDTFSARRAREHADANVLCLGAWALGRGAALEVARAFLEASFLPEERHRRRVEKIRALEEDWRRGCPGREAP